MKRLKLLAAVIALTFTGLTVTLPSVARANAWDMKTIFTVGQDFVIPGAQYTHGMNKIPAGTYIVKFLSSQGVKTVAVVYNETEQDLMATVIPVATDNTYDMPSSRSAEADEHNAVSFERDANRAAPLRLSHWNYPGSDIGYTFADKLL